MCVPEDRITSLREEKPKTRKKLRAFLSTINFYRKFIPNIHKLTSELTHATSKKANAVVEWSRTMEDAFHHLRESLCSCVSLCIPVYNDQFVLETDACNTGVGTVLQVRRGEELHLVAFYSCQLKGAETNYPAQELEGLALFRAVNHFSFYLYGNYFEVCTDHEGLVSMLTKPQHNRSVL